MSQKPSIYDSFLTEAELADRWRKSRRTLQRWRAANTGPAYHEINGRILYALRDIAALEAVTRRVPKE